MPTTRRRIARAAAALVLAGAVALSAWQAMRRTEATAARAQPASAAGATPSATRTNDGAPAITSSQPQAGTTSGDPADARCHRARRGAMQAMRDRLRAAASPEDVALRLLLAPLSPGDDRPEEAWREAQAAVQRWPDSVELAWIAWDRCDPAAGCDRSAASAHLQRVDGDNLFAWLPALAEAHRQGDQAAYSQALRRAADAEFSDSRMGTAFLRLRPALASIPLDPQCRNAPGIRAMAATLGRPVDARVVADMEAMAIDTALATPALSGLAGCHAMDGPLPAPMQSDCRRMLSLLATGDTFLERNAALPLLVALAPDAVTRAQWQDAYRRLQWLQRLAPEMPRIDGVLWRQWAEGEVAMMQAHARDTGRWPPPDHWMPDDARSREVLARPRSP